MKYPYYAFLERRICDLPCRHLLEFAAIRAEFHLEHLHFCYTKYLFISVLFLFVNWQQNSSTYALLSYAFCKRKLFEGCWFKRLMECSFLDCG